MKNVEILYIGAVTLGIATPSLLVGWLVGMVTAFGINHYYKKHFKKDDRGKKK